MEISEMHGQRIRWLFYLLLSLLDLLFDLEVEANREICAKGYALELFASCYALLRFRREVVRSNGLLERLSEKERFESASF